MDRSEAEHSQAGCRRVAAQDNQSLAHFRHILHQEQPPGIHSSHWVEQSDHSMAERKGTDYNHSTEEQTDHMQQALRVRLGRILEQVVEVNHQTAAGSIHRQVRRPDCKEHAALEHQKCMDMAAALAEHLDTSVLQAAGLVELAHKEALRHMPVCRMVWMTVEHTFQAVSQWTAADHTSAVQVAGCHIWVHYSHAHNSAARVEVGCRVPNSHKHLKFVPVHSCSLLEHLLKLELIQAEGLMVGCQGRDHLGYSNHSHLAVEGQSA